MLMRMAKNKDVSAPAEAEHATRTGRNKEEKWKRKK